MSTQPASTIALIFQNSFKFNRNLTVNKNTGIDREKYTIGDKYYSTSQKLRPDPDTLDYKQTLK